MTEQSDLKIIYETTKSRTIIYILFVNKEVILIEKKNKLIAHYMDVYDHL